MPRRHRARERRRAATSAPSLPETPSRPPSGVVRIDTQDDACGLADHLLSPSRSWPVAVVTTAADAGRPYVDVDALKADVGELAEVVLVPTGDVSWAFSDKMPPLTQVYGGASRVYSVERDWVDDPYRSRLRFAYAPADGERVRARLVHDALGAAQRAGLVGGSTPAAPTSRVRGRVRGVVGSRAVVDLDDGGQAVVAEELTGAGVPLTQVLAPGQEVRGTLDPSSRLLGVDLPDDDASRRLVRDAYRPGDVVLVSVRDAEPDAVTVRLAPRCTYRVPRHLVTGNDLDALDDLFTPGEVVLARVLPDADGTAVRLDDVDDVDDVPVPALALLPGGPPWLVPTGPPADTPEPVAPPAPPDPAPVPVPHHPGTTQDPPQPALPAPSPALLAARHRGEHVPAPPPTRRDEAPSSGVPAAPYGAAPARRALLDAQLALAEARGRAERAEREALAHDRRAAQLAADNRHLLAEVENLRSRVERLDHQVHEQRRKYRVADRRRQQAVRDQARGAAAPDDGPWFTDPGEQFRHEVYEAWVRTVAAGEKASLPLGRYTLGPRFLDSLDEIEGVSRRKVAETVVHVVTGRAPSVNGLQLHPLRAAETGRAPQRTRDDGAGCWRVSLQVNSPSARRLHFWRLPDGSVELSRVVLHDDVEP